MRIFLVVISLMVSFSISAQNQPPKSGSHLYESSLSDGTPYTYEGDFERHTFHGTGIYKQEGTVADGTFENGCFSSGTYIVTSPDLETKDTGIFETREDYIYTGNLLDGEKTSTTSLGVITLCKYENGNRTTCTSNNRNNYDINDLQGPKKTTIDVHSLSNENYLPIGFGSKKIDMLWDTGAWGFVVNTEDFEMIQSLCKQDENDDLSLKMTGIKQESYTANGQGTLGEVFLINGVYIGEIRIDSLVIIYDPGMTHSLLGMNFFKKLSNVKWDMKDQKMVLFK